MHALQATLAVIGVGILALIAYGRYIGVSLQIYQRALTGRVFMLLATVSVGAMLVAQYFFF